MKEIIRNRGLSVMGGIAALLAALVAVLVVYTAMDLRQAKHMANEACSRARQGMPLDEYLPAYAGKDYRLIKGTPQIILVPRKGMGRYHCTVTHDGMRITGSKVNFID